MSVGSHMYPPTKVLGSDVYTIQGVTHDTLDVFPFQPRDIRVQSIGHLRHKS